MILSDSIHSIQPDISSEQGEMMLDAPMEHGYPIRHPYQVLRTLPKDATPAQQDSAIQAVFQPGEIHYSERPDTLRLPGQPLGKSVRDVSLPQYYKESFFKTDTLFHPELNGGRMGIPGDPVPYRAANDDVITIVLLICFMMTVLMVSRSLRFIFVQAKDILYTFREDSVEMKETASEVNYQIFLCLQAGLLLALSFFFYAQETIGETYILSSEYALMGVFFSIFIGYFLVKELMYSWVHYTFFESRQRRQSMVARLFLTAMEGVLMLPAVLVHTYFGMSSVSLLTYAIIVIILTKILSFYKTYTIFFREKGLFLQNFLYFCTLEAVPLAMLWGILLFVADYLKVTY